MNHLSVNYGEVLDVCMSHCKVSMDDIMGERRNPNIAKARAMFCCCMYDLGYSYPDIANMLARKSHSTVSTRVLGARKNGEYKELVLDTLILVWKKRLGVLTNSGIENNYNGRAFPVPVRPKRHKIEEEMA